MRVLFYCVKGAGHVNPTLPIVRELVARGHEVFYSVTLEWAERIPALGATFLNVVGEGPFTTANYHPGKPFALQLLPAAAAILPRLVEEARSLAPDVIVHDSMAPWGRIVAGVLGVRAVCSSSTFPFGRNEGADLIDAAGADPVNLEAVRTIETRWGQPCSTEEVVGFFSSDTLVYSCIELSACDDDERHRFHHVGCSIASDDARSVLEAANLPVAPSPGRKRLYLSMGTVAASVVRLNEDFFRQFIAAFPPESGWDVVISLGKACEPAALEPLPPNVIVRSSVPQTAVLQHTDIFVTHAGANSLHESLNFGVPMVCIPCFGDQPWNTRRAVAKGVATELSLTELTPETIRQAVERMADDESARTAARALGECLRRGGGVPKAVEVIVGS